MLTAVAPTARNGAARERPDPLDRRRTLVRTTPALKAVEERLGSVSIDDILARDLAAEDREELTDVIAALDLLSRLLTPEVLSDDEETSPVPHELLGARLKPKGLSSASSGRDSR